MIKDDRSTAYNCIIPDERSAAILLLRKRKYSVKVKGASRDTFTISIPKSLSRLLKCGKQCELKYAGEHWTTRIGERETSDNILYSMTLSRLEEISPVHNPRTSLFTLFFRSKSDSTSDPVMPFALLGVLAVSIMVLPGWGEELGTSEFITNLCTSSIKALSEMFS